MAGHDITAYVGYAHPGPACKPIADRFWPKVQRVEDGCWEWQASRTSRGYGRIGLGRKEEGWTVAHRVSWEIHNGPISDGLFVLHRCDNPPCVNPDHLFLGTLADNSQDMMRKGRGRAQIPTGEAHPAARLTDEQIMEMRSLAPSVASYAELGRSFGVSKQHARNVVMGARRR